MNTGESQLVACVTSTAPGTPSYLPFHSQLTHCADSSRYLGNQLLTPSQELPSWLRNPWGPDLCSAFGWELRCTWWPYLPTVTPGLLNGDATSLGRGKWAARCPSRDGTETAASPGVGSIKILLQASCKALPSTRRVGTGGSRCLSRCAEGTGTAGRSWPAHF